MTNAASILQAALAYARAGLRVFPTDTAKHPMVHWKDDATTDEATLRDWWARHPLAGIGWVLPSGVVVVDIDPGGDAVVRAAGGLPKTGPIARTPRRGWHFILALPDDGPWRQRGLGLHVDARVGGLGYIILPPSTGRSWYILPVSLAGLGDPDRLPPVPAWVVALLRANPALPGPSQPARVGGPIGPLARWVAAAQPGERNGALFWAANRARDDGWALDAALPVLADAAMATRQPDEPPDDYRDAAIATIRSAYR